MLGETQKEASEASVLYQAIEKNSGRAGTPSTTALCRARDGHSVRTREEDLAHADSYPQAAPSGAVPSLKRVCLGPWH